MTLKHDFLSSLLSIAATARAGLLSPAQLGAAAQRGYVALSPRLRKNQAEKWQEAVPGQKQKQQQQQQQRGEPPALLPPRRGEHAQLDKQVQVPPGYNPAVDVLQETEFGRLRGRVYADYAGAPPYPASLLAAVTAALASGLHGNPHSEAGWGEAPPGGGSGTAAAAAARQATLAACCARADEYECILTSGATAALKLVGEAFPWGGAGAAGAAGGGAGGHGALVCGGGGGGGAPGAAPRGAGAAAAAGVFLYLRDNHTSVLGLRQLAAERGAAACAAFEVVAAPAAEGDAFSLRLCGGAEQAAAVAAAADESSGAAKERQHLLAFPLESNFSGVRYDLSLAAAAQAGCLSLLPPAGAGLPPRLPPGRWRVLLDAAKGAASGPPDLSAPGCRPDFVVLSYYKLFGMPTGEVGARGWR